jgi:HEAT repeat protein
MLKYDNFAIVLGRAVETFRSRPEAIDEQKVALRALVALTKLGRATLVVQDGELVVETERVARTLPGITTLVDQMDAHAIAEIRIAQNASASDLLHLLRGLALGLGAYADGRDIGARLSDSHVTSVRVLTIPPEVQVTGRRPVSVTDAFNAAEVVAAVSEATAHAMPSALEEAIQSLALDPSGPTLLDRASAAAELVRQALDGDRVSEGLRALAELIRLEAAMQSGPRRSYAVVLKRLLTRGVLQTAAEQSRHPEDAAVAGAVLRRAGAEATEVLLERLVQADGIAERRHWFDLLRDMNEGLRQVILMLGHSEWYVVRNVADLLGELRVREAVVPLARTLRHLDPRARRAAAVALARVRAPETIEYLAALLRDSDPELRMSVAGAIGDPEHQALAMPLVLATERERDPRVLLEFCRALGRIRSPAAVQALGRAAQPGRWWWRRRRPRARVAAIEGLKVAAGPVATGILEGLLRDHDADVRRAAREALEDLDVL